MRAAAAAALVPSDDAIAIARTVIYASLFDYPLTVAQLRESLIESVQTEAGVLATYRSSPSLRAAVSYENGFFFPAGRRDLIAIRRRRERHSLEFLERHRTLLNLICAWPFVRMVAISGSLAHLNLDHGGDLDLFVITRGRRVWLTAVAIVLLAKLLGCRRTVCANFVLADSNLAVGEPDLFTANQIIHLKPIVGADAFREFVEANAFVTALYPNFSPERAAEFPFAVRRGRRWARRAVERLLSLPSIAADLFCRAAYGQYLRHRSGSWQSPVHVRLEADCLKLHTRSHREPVLARFDLAMTEAIGCDVGRAG